MYINCGNNLFLPEGDDYSKTEFDEHAECLTNEGNLVLAELRKAQSKPNVAAVVKKKASPPRKETKEKMTYKEILDSMSKK